MSGILFAIFGGVIITLQGVFSSRISARIGLWETNTLIHLAGLVLTMMFLVFKGDGSFAKLNQVPVLYWPGLCIGALIVFSTIMSISKLGPTLAITILLISQLLVAVIIEYCGLFETMPLKFHFTKPLGLGLMITGIIVFKLKDF